jgi:hypothetical protein
LLAHPAKAKAMMGNVNKTDKLDARGLATLLRNGTLPRVWIAPNEVRDQRELPRTRMALCKIRVALKNRIQPRLAAQAVNSDRRDDILIWRYKKEKLEELGPFADSLLGFASHFVPAVREGASRVGLLPSASKKRGWFGK